MTDLPPLPGLPQGLAQSLGASRPGAGGLGCYRVQGRPPAAGARGQQGSLQPPRRGGRLRCSFSPDPRSIPRASAPT